MRVTLSACLVWGMVAAGALRAPAQESRDDLTPLELTYTTIVAEDRQSVEVVLEVQHVARPRTHVAMPNWTPGAYSIGRYGERVEDLRVTGPDGGPLEWLAMDHQTWSIDTAGVGSFEVRYRVPARNRRFGSRSRAGSDGEQEEITGFQVAGPSTYLYVEGAKHLPVTARYEVPDGWCVRNGLREGGTPMERLARDYDTFIDAPTQLGLIREETFRVNDVLFRCVFFQNSQEYDFDIPAFVEVVRKIVTYQGELYGSFPFREYVFLFTLPGGGGLEHLNSTSIGLSPEGMKRDVKSGASVTSHEFFHLWNVKRIRPKVLGPFEYEQENYTGNLWVSEGWTSYYGDLTMVRTGITTRDQYLRHHEGILSNELNKDTRHTQSVYWASRNVWHRDRDEPRRVDYYGTGEMLAAMIDLKIRHETGNRKSLDDVMRFLNRWFAERDEGFEEGDIERACTAVSNHDFGEFFARYVTGVLDPPLAEIFGHAGIDYQGTIIPVAFPFSARATPEGLRIGGRPTPPAEGEEVDEDAPRPGDTILTVDGAKVEDLDRFLLGHAAGDKVTLSLKRDEREWQREVELEAAERLVPKLSFRGDVTEQQLRLRESWLTGQ